MSLLRLLTGGEASSPPTLFCPDLWTLYAICLESGAHLTLGLVVSFYNYYDFAFHEGPTHSWHGGISHSYKTLGLSRWYSHSKAIQLGRAAARIQSQICWISKAGVLHLQHHVLPRWDSRTTKQTIGNNTSWAPGRKTLADPANPSLGGPILC